MFYPCWLHNLILVSTLFISLSFVVNRFGHLVDVYAWTPHCRYLDGLGPSGTFSIWNSTISLLIVSEIWLYDVKRRGFALKRKVGYGAKVSGCDEK